MKPKGNDALLGPLQSFFHEYLEGARGASNHTIRAYSDGLRLFFLFLADRVRHPITDLSLHDVRAEAVLAFLHHVETVRGNSVTTRNCRLAAIRSFAQHLVRHDVTRAEQYGRILAIPPKRTRQRVITYLEPEEARAMIATARDTTAPGMRDRALLLFLYNTGARVSEALAVCSRDLQLGRPRQVRLHGKGGKQRICPLWAETAASLRWLLRDSSPADEPVFRNARGAPLTRDGVAYLVTKYARRAVEAHPTLRQRRVTPHVLRHSCAVALLQAGVDVTVIRDYLGHASIATTSRYLTTNLQMKREALEAFWSRAGLDPRPTRTWHPSAKLLDFLTSL
jgi:site-specific recombinase XerD